MLDNIDSLDFTIRYKDRHTLGDNPEFEATDISGYILCEDFSKESFKGFKRIGRFEGYLIPLEDAQEYAIDTFEAFDIISQEVFTYYEGLFKGNDLATFVKKQFRISEPLNRVLVLTQIKINKKYKGYNIGLAVLSRIIKDFGAGCDLILGKPFPLQYHGCSNEVDSEGKPTDKYKATFLRDRVKLFKHYSQIGFNRIGKTDFIGMRYKDLIPHYVLTNQEKMEKLAKKLGLEK